MQLRGYRRALAQLGVLALFAMMLVAVAAPAGASGTGHGGVVLVTNGNDAGPGSFRAAVRYASANPSIHTVAFTEAHDVDLTDSVVYTGHQDLAIRGSGGTLSGASGDPAANWDAALFVSDSAASITVSNLEVVDSFGSGVVVLIPEGASGTVRVTLKHVTIADSRYHGLYVDGQLTDDYNTDDEPHDNCIDPHPYDSAAGIKLVVKSSSIVDNGRLDAGYDDSTATGCPRDFDGIRVDEGGKGGVRAWIGYTDITGNLADGAEYDERGPGGVFSTVKHSTFASNGESGTTVDNLEDLDDGFDIDEAGDGRLVARFESVVVSDNRDEGLDLDEEGSGGAWLWVRRVTADNNEDQGVKIDEAGPGSLFVSLSNSSVTNTISQDGVEFTEEDAGNLVGSISRSQITGNDQAGVKAEQVAPGMGKLLIANSDLSGNTDGALDLEGVVETLVNVIT
jgi:hypothetical protein